MQAAKPRLRLPGELFTLLGMVSVAFAVTLLIKARFGVSAISGVPYVLSLAFPRLSLGGWNTLIQCLWLGITMLLIGKVKPGYLFSFVLAFIFGPLLDLAHALVSLLPDAVYWRVVWFIAGYAGMAVGISCFFVCGTPVLPFDTVPRAFVMEKGVSARKARTAYDLIHLFLLVAVGLLFLGRVVAVGFATVFNAITLGYTTGRIIAWLGARVEIRPHFRWMNKLV